MSRLDSPPQTLRTQPLRRTNHDSSRNLVRTVVGATIGITLIIGVWWHLSRAQSPLVLPSPMETWHALLDLIDEGVVWPALLHTFGRALVGVGLALLVGVIWGIASGLSKWVAAISAPAMSGLLAVPPVVVVAVGLVWFGPGTGVTRLVILIVALPLLVVALQEAIRTIDADLMEMAAIFHVSPWRKIRHVILPSISSHIAVAVTITFGQALRVTVMAELLAAADGIGAEIARARTNLETPDLFAWAILMVIAVAIVEMVVLQPIQMRAQRWRLAHSAT